MNNMTVLTRDLFNKTQKLNCTDDAIELLLSYDHFRTFGDVLRKFSPEPELKSHLVRGLQQWFPEDNLDSIDRKVRNWLNGKTQNISKQDAYILCQILHLTLPQANEFLGYATGESIHWRNPEDIVWCYTILHNYSPEQAMDLLERSHAAMELPKNEKTGAPSSYTAEINDRIQKVLHLEEDALLAFLQEERSRLGTFHNTAYQLFDQYMGLLKRGYSELGMEALFEEMTREEKKKVKSSVDGDVGPHKAEPITVRDILETYMYRKFVPVQTRGKAKSAEFFSPIQRNIRQNWPDEYSLSKIESRKQDVSRKTLILLFLATDGTDSDFDEFDDLETADDVFLSLYTRLDAMLNACGFPKLDPRNPFDWMILFCISSGDLWESDMRLQEILIKMYSSDPLPNTNL
ncbi:MAG: hypothetical protein MR828_12660 [Clostridiales bacterium]|nr:hypothetical protein [Clostridiales bacterium]